MEIIVKKGKKLRDKSGEPIYFKKPYFDKGLRRTFKSAEEKANFLNKHNIVDYGDSQAKADRQRKEYHEKMMDTDRKYKTDREKRRMTKCL